MAGRREVVDTTSMWTYAISIVLSERHWQIWVNQTPSLKFGSGSRWTRPGPQILSIESTGMALTAMLLRLHAYDF